MTPNPDVAAPLTENRAMFASPSIRPDARQASAA
jgi:hypothetical protein